MEARNWRGTAPVPWTEPQFLHGAGPAAELGTCTKEGAEPGRRPRGGMEACIQWAGTGPAGRHRPSLILQLLHPASPAPDSAAAFRLTSLCLEFAAAAADALAANFTGSGLGSVRGMESSRRGRVGVGAGAGVGTRTGLQGGRAEACPSQTGIQWESPGSAAEGAGMVECPGIVRQVCIGPGAWEGFPV